MNTEKYNSFQLQQRRSFDLRYLCPKATVSVEHWKSSKGKDRYRATCYKAGREVRVFYANKQSEITEGVMETFSEALQ